MLSVRCVFVYVCVSERTKGVLTTANAFFAHIVIPPD